MTSVADAGGVHNSRAIVVGVKCITGKSWAILLVLLHLFVAPCATAMVLMPADMDCEHCQSASSPDACDVASSAAGAVSGGVAIDSGASPGRAASLLPTAPGVLLLPLELTASLPGAPPTANQARLATRHTGDPPLYLLLGQLRI